nr:probable ubiquitin-conjugating enzyme E2 24 [Ipomoea batatas]
MDLNLSDIDSESSNSEDQDYAEHLFGGNAYSILSSLKESIEKIDDFLSFERVFSQGDIVCLVTDPSGQTGRVVNVDLVVDLENIYGHKIREVSSKKLQKIRSMSVGDHVVYGPWLGKIEKVVDRITVLFDDGAKSEFTTMGPEKFTPVSPDLLEDPQYPFYPGQRVMVQTQPVVPQSTKWLCGARYDKRDLGTICNVDAGVVYVDWLGCATNQDEKVSAPAHFQDSKNLTLLSCFSDTKWEIGDWCLLPDSDYENAQQSSVSPPLCGFPGGDEQPRKLFQTRSQKVEELAVIVRTKAKVDVLWQDGNITAGLNSDSLFPVNIVDAHDFWPDQFVLEKGVCDDSSISSLHRWGVVKSVDAKERTVKVKWSTFHAKELNFDGEHVEETVSAYELMDHPDFPFCVGDAVFRSNLTHINSNIDENRCPCIDYSSSIGIIVGFKDGNIKVKWATGAISMVAPYEIYHIDKSKDASTTTIPYGENLEQSNVEVNLQGDQFSRDKGKDSLDFDGNGISCKEKPLASGSCSLSQAAIGLFSSIGSSLFSSLSTSLFGGYQNISQEKKPEILDEETVLHCTLDTDPPPPAVTGSKKSGEENSEQVMEEAELKNEDAPSTSSKLPENFKRFDMVNDCSDHHFVDGTGKDVQSSQVKRGWTKRVQQEWNILEHDLPDTIYVRVYEERMDLLRAAVVGAPGTPYHDGLFFFDICFPPEYPHEPPMVYYHSGGLRVNPNLYESGKVCLSLLNTWTGSGNEVWNPKSSTILQVLLSLQALVLNEKPYFNEAGYDTQIGKADGEKNSVSYNENAYLVTCKSMLYLLRKPPKHFEALIEEHFSKRGEHILLACKAYMGGAAVGSASRCLYSDQEQIKGSSKGFKIMLAKLFPQLVEAFSDKGIDDCSQFLNPSE